MTTESMNAPRALVVGLGVSGMATAISLRTAGWVPVVIERAPERRRGGYCIALAGAGRSAAERLGILDALHDRTAAGGHSYEIDRAGHRRPGIGFGDLSGQVWMMLRGDVEQAAYTALDRLGAAGPDGGGPVEIRYCTVPTAIEQDDDGVDVTLYDSSDGTTRRERFELVVGADGLRSTVRRLAFGPHEDYLRRLNYMVAAFDLPADLPGFAPGEGAILTEQGRSFWVFPFADHAPTALFTYRTDDVDAEFATTPAERIRQVYGPEPFGDVLGAAIDQLDASTQALFDSVEQVHLDAWHRGRVVLVGDSAWCVTLYSGMGVSCGLAGADLLGTMLARYPDDPDTALVEWEKQLRPFIEVYQEAGLRGRVVFTPASRGEKVRRSIMLHMRRSPIAGRLLGWATDSDRVMRMRNADIAADIPAA